MKKLLFIIPLLILLSSCGKQVRDLAFKRKVDKIEASYNDKWFNTTIEKLDTTVKQPGADLGTDIDLNQLPAIDTSCHTLNSFLNKILFDSSINGLHLKAVYNSKTNHIDVTAKQDSSQFHLQIFKQTTENHDFKATFNQKKVSSNTVVKAESGTDWKGLVIGSLIIIAIFFVIILYTKNVFR